MLAPFHDLNPLSSRWGIRPGVGERRRRDFHANKAPGCGFVDTNVSVPNWNTRNALSRAGGQKLVSPRPVAAGAASSLTSSGLLGMYHGARPRGRTSGCLPMVADSRVADFRRAS